MGRVKIKHPRPKEIGVRRRLADILSPTLKLTRLIPTSDAVVVLTPTDKDADAIFSTDISAQLAAEGFTPVVPPELRALRTIICSGLDELVLEHSEEEIAAEVGAQHTWAKAESVFKFPRSTTAKITFRSGDMARKAMLEGLHLFQIHIAGHQMRQEVYIPLLTCNKCNAVEDHPTSSCPKPASYMRCSECSEEGHIFRNCTAASKKCLNCGGDHSARAMRCPTRKEALKRKEETARQARVKPSVSYAQVAQAPQPTTPSPSVFGAPDPSKTLAGLMCLFHAHLANAAAPGCFQQTLSAGLAENGLPDVKLPPPPPLQSSDAMARALAMGGSLTAAVPPASVPPAATPTPPEDATDPDDAVSVASSSTSSSSTSSTSSSSSEETEDAEEPEEASVPSEGVSFCFFAKTNTRRKIPTTGSEFDRCLRQGSMILCHTGPPEVEEMVKNHARENLDSLHHWLEFSNEAFEKARRNPNQRILDALPGRIPPARK